MSKWRKITRIIWKTILFSLLFIVVFGGLMVLVVQTETFQTWAAKKVTAYLSNELHTKVDIGRLKISLVSNVTLEGVYLSDMHNDTLVYGKSITVDVSGFSFNKKKLNLDEVKLSGIKVKLLKYKNEEDWNFQYLADYFASTDSLPNDTTPSPWKIKYGALKLDDVDFTYHLLRDTDKVVQNMNFNHIKVSHAYGTLTEVSFKGDTIGAQITGLRAIEQCGLELKSLTTKARISSTELRCDSIYLRTANSFIRGKLSFKYDQWEDYLDFINKVYIKGRLKDSTYVNFKDIAYFAEELNGIHEVLVVKGKVRGFVNDLSGTEMMVSYRGNTQFVGDMSITGLPDIDKSFIHFDAQKLSTSKADSREISHSTI